MSNEVAPVTIAVAYYRVSTLDQTRKYGLAYQQRTVRDLCASKGYTLVEEFTEPGVSGLENPRPPRDGQAASTRARWWNRSRRRL